MFIILTTIPCFYHQAVINQLSFTHSYILQPCTAWRWLHFEGDVPLLIPGTAVPLLCSGVYMCHRSKSSCGQENIYSKLDTTALDLASIIFLLIYREDNNI